MYNHNITYENNSLILWKYKYVNLTIIYFDFNI